MSSAVSSSALTRRLDFFFFVIGHLLQSAFVKSLGNPFCVGRQPSGSNLSQRRQLVPPDVFALTLGEAIKKHGAMARAIRDEHPISARSPLPRSSRPLLNDPTAQVGV